MRKISSVVSAAQVNNIDYQFKAARKYQSAFNGLYTISGDGTNPVMIEMFNHDAALIWSLASIVISATSAGFKVIEKTNRKNQLTRVVIRPYQPEEPENEPHVFENVTSPQMMLVMLEVANIIELGVEIVNGAEIPNIKYFHDDGTVVNAQPVAYTTEVEQVSSNDLLRDLLSRINTSELFRTVQNQRTEAVQEEVTLQVAPSPIRVDAYTATNKDTSPESSNSTQAPYISGLTNFTSEGKGFEKFAIDTGVNDTLVHNWLKSVSSENLVALDEELKKIGCYNTRVAVGFQSGMDKGVVFYPDNFVFRFKNMNMNQDFFLGGDETLTDYSQFVFDTLTGKIKNADAIKYAKLETAIQKFRNPISLAEFPSISNTFDGYFLKNKKTGKIGIPCGTQTKSAGFMTSNVNARVMVNPVSLIKDSNAVVYEGTTESWWASEFEVYRN